jgi:hypothetical protein
MSGGNEMNFVLECVMSSARGFLLLRPITKGA